MKLFFRENEKRNIKQDSSLQELCNKYDGDCG